MNEIIDISNYTDYDIGTKASRLFDMKKNHINVPNLICVKRDLEQIDDYLKRFSTKTFSVRSSCNLEDSSNNSFAGQFKTFLNVEKKDVRKKVRECLAFIDSENVELYCKEKNIDKSSINMNVIIQEQIEADCSGIIFTVNPLGILNEMVLVVGSGEGNNIVEDRENVTTYYYNRDDKKYYYSQQGYSIVLPKNTINEIIENALKIEKIFGFYQDIEFAIKNGEVFFLQSRNITTLDLNKKRIILDNSNIVESYPGITLPLTQSFACEVYYRIFKKCFYRITSSKKYTKKYDNMLKNMVAVANGRMYYQINNFYNFLVLLPFSKKIIPIWQEMLGVKDKQVFSDNAKASFNIKFRIFFNFINLVITNRKKMDKLKVFIEEYIKEAEKIIQNCNTKKDYLAAYDLIMDVIIQEWDITLVNDLYAFVFVHALNNKEYISQVTNLESMKPIIELKNIDSQEKKEEYIRKYGDRVLEELKLETKTYRTNPELLDIQIEKYKNIKIDVPNVKRKNGFIAKRAISGIRNREWSRLYRTRIYGMARDIYLKIGEIFEKERKIDSQRDIFYLTIDEIRKEENSYIDLVKERKLKYENYYNVPDYSRIVYLDKIIEREQRNIKSLNSTDAKKLYGIGTSSGTIEGEVVIIKDNKDIDVTDKILVTKTTDPGWIFLISKCKGIIAEKGSLLSHTAIISRELKKPAIVGVENVTEILKDGQHVLIDADKGEIKCIN